MRKFEKFDCCYWGIIPEKLEFLEKTVKRIGKQYRLTSDDYQQIEEEAMKYSEDEVKCYVHPAKNFTEIICISKLQAFISFLCNHFNLNPDDFCFDLTGVKVRLIYQGEDL